MRTGAGRRKIEQSGDDEPWLAFETNLLHAKAFAAQLAGHTGVERRAFRKTAEGLDETRAKFALIDGDRVGGSESIVTLLPAGEHGLRLTSNMVTHRAFTFAGVGSQRQHAQGFGVRGAVLGQRGGECDTAGTHGGESPQRAPDRRFARRRELMICHIALEIFPALRLQPKSPTLNRS